MTTAGCSWSTTGSSSPKDKEQLPHTSVERVFSQGQESCNISSRSPRQIFQQDRPVGKRKPLGELWWSRNMVRSTGRQPQS